MIDEFLPEERHSLRPSCRLLTLGLCLLLALLLSTFL